MAKLATYPSVLGLVLAVLVLGVHVNSQVTEQMRWSQVSFTGSTSPGGCSQCGMAYDRLRNRLVLFAESDTQETWFFDLSTRTWTAATTTNKPPKRFSVVAAIDQTGGRDRFIVSTGEGNVNGKRTFFNDVWALDLNTLAWRQLAQNGAVPDVRYGSAGGTWFVNTTYLMITHGFKGDTRFDDSFVYDLVNEVWYDISPSSRPSARCLHAGAQTDGGKLYMFGGCGSGGFGPCPAQDTWVLNSGASSTVRPWEGAKDWDRLQSCPGPRIRPSMSIAPGHTTGTTSVQRLLLFGGSGKPFGNGAKGDYSLLDTATGKWHNYHAADGAAPAVRQAAVMVYVNQHADHLTSGDYVIVYGGSGGADTMWNLTADATSGVERFGCPYIFNMRQFHGSLMFLSWGLLLPIGATAARFGKHWPNALWWKIHRPVQAFGVFLGIGGFITALIMLPVGKFSAKPHAQIGIVVTVLGFLQPINAYFRPHKHDGQPVSTKRIVWEYLHKYCGRIALILGMIQPFQGLKFILAPTGLQIAYGIYFACWVLLYVTLTIMGKPDTSPVAQFISTKLCCGSRIKDKQEDVGM